ncbi:hypothetical protein BDK89_1028 [Ilumatobacter fluminis]|uniref:Uncharacterized protein n=1 Tax=Ilumatobacter fluminis TaxID=467091 RepID=A0A4R7HWI6_9ACTN|nr:hypothetical protein [Ilumatobacter fluminis]TDT15457.1 hypothetical protein BDK89_1028 [Ilumatobacter fluminis]
MQQLPLDPPQQLGTGHDVGATFIEVLVSIVLLGTAGIAVLSALAASATGAAVQREVSTAQAALASAADAVIDVDAADDNYALCASPHSYDPLVAGSSPDATVSVTRVEFWNSTTQTYQPSCVSGEADRLQRITLTATDGDHTASLAVVKRRAGSPTLNTVPAAPNAGDGGMVTPTPHSGL